MTDAMRVLYQYAQEREVRKYLLSPEYCNICQAEERQTQALLEKYPDIGPQLDDLLSESNLSQSFEQEAIFQAAFVIAADLFSR